MEHTESGDHIVFEKTERAVKRSQEEIATDTRFVFPPGVRKRRTPRVKVKTAPTSNANTMETRTSIGIPPALPIPKRKRPMPPVASIHIALDSIPQIPFQTSTAPQLSLIFLGVFITVGVVVKVLKNF